MKYDLYVKRAECCHCCIVTSKCTFTKRSLFNCIAAIVTNRIQTDEIQIIKLKVKPAYTRTLLPVWYFIFITIVTTLGY